MPGPLKKVKKYRFQLLHKWLIENHRPCKVADIGGGSGLLTHLLNQTEGWESVVIDPRPQPLPWKYKSLAGERVKAPKEREFPRKLMEFQREMAADYDLLVGMHSHGTNRAIIDGAREYNKDFIIFPCCVIDEPIEKQPGVNWFNSLVEYAKEVGFEPRVIELNFKGKNRGIANF